ncbi:MAG: phosphate-starvation-inducible PsiE family protein [Microcystis aeruginosa WS75]|nr:phosphate-starvation-inducible PsiE family protein [Microcystis aeruginosa WS75]
MLKQIRKILINFGQQWRDENFMRSIHTIENLVSKVLSVALIVVIIVSLYDLVVILIKDLFTTEPIGFFSKTLIEIFGLFLNILIALELLENVTAYLRKHIVQVELVVVTALIAISRKIIIFDPNKYSKDDLIALTVGTLALAASYWLIRKVNRDNRS